MSEPTTDKLPDRKWSFEVGCLSGILCGIAGAVLGGFWGVRLDDERHANMVDDWVPQWTIFWILVGAPVGWATGWLLTALLPRKCRRTLGDSITILVCGLFPAAIYAIIMWWVILSAPRPVVVR